MKFNLKTSLFIFLISSSLVMNEANAQTGVAEAIGMVVPYVKVVKDALDFCKKVFDVSTESNKRFGDLSNTLQSVMQFSQESVTKMAAEITMTLRGASDRYDAMILDVRTMCIFNIDTRDNYHYFIGSSVDHSDWRKETKRRFSFLNAMINRTLLETIRAKGEIKMIHTDVTSVSGKLVFIRETFDSLANKKRTELQGQIQQEELNIKNAHWRFLFFHGRDSKKVEAAETNKQALEKNVRLLNKFMDDTKAYVDWLEKAGNELKQASQVRGLDIADMQGVAEAKKSLVQFLRTIPDDEDDPEDTKEYVFSSIDLAVKNISDLSFAFIKKTSTAETSMMNEPFSRTKRSFGGRRQQSYEGALDEDDTSLVAPLPVKQKVRFDVTEKKVNVMIVFPLEKTLQTFKAINKSLPYLDDATIRQSSLLTIFFESGVDFLDNLRSSFDTSANAFVSEIATVARMRNESVNTPQMRGNIAQLVSEWNDRVLELRRLGHEWNSYLSSTAEDYKKMPSSFKRRMNLEENKGPVRNHIEDKLRDVVGKLENLRDGPLKQTLSLVGQLSSLAGIRPSNDGNVYYHMDVNKGGDNDSNMSAEAVARKTVDYFVRILQSGPAAV